MSWIHSICGKSRRHRVKRNWRHVTKGIGVAVCRAVFLTSTQGGVESRFRYSQTRSMSRDVNAEGIASTASLCPIISGKTCSLLNALSDSATSTEAEARLLVLLRCFLAIRNESLSNPSFQPNELLKADARICLLRMVQIECLGSIITRMQHDDSSFKQTLHFHHLKDHIICSSLANSSHFYLHMAS